MHPDPEPDAEVVSRYIALSHPLAVSGRQAEAMVRELKAYGRATAALRALLSPADQPANFAMALSARRSAIDEGVS